MTKLIVFGPTGKSGLAVIDTALQNEAIEVSVFIRSPHKLPDHFKSKVHCIVGDVYDSSGVADAILGHDIVISCLGKGMNLLYPTTVISTGIKNIVSGMRKHGVTKLITISICSLLSTYTKKPPVILRNLTDDHERAMKFLKEVDDINWIAISPPEILKLPHTGAYTATVDVLPGGRLVTTAYDIAHLIVSYVTSNEKFTKDSHQMVGISSSLTWSQLFNYYKFPILVGTAAAIGVPSATYMYGNKTVGTLLGCLVLTRVFFLLRNTVFKG